MSEDEVVEESDSDLDTEMDIDQQAKSIEFEALPDKSKPLYIKCYNSFEQWRLLQKPPDLTENLMFVYFVELSKKYKPNTLVSTYSKLKAVIKLKFDIRIELWSKVTGFKKKNTKGYHETKAAIFRPEEINTFLKTAPDFDYLPLKVALILGCGGACRGGELHHLNLAGLKIVGDRVLELTLFDTKNVDHRSFTIEGTWYDMIKKYYDLRPQNLSTTNFFINYQKGKCTKQNIGKNKIAKWPKEIATFLKLNNPESYKGHSFRRTAATLLADSGGSMLDVKRLGGWKSSSVAESYIDNSTTNRRRVSNQIKEFVSGEKTPDKKSQHENLFNEQDVNKPSTSTSFALNEKKKDGKENFSTIIQTHYHFNNCTLSNLSFVHQTSPNQNKK